MAINPIEVIRLAQNSVPAVRYAMAVGAIASVVAIVAGYNLDPRVAVFGSIIVLGSMFVMVVFAALASSVGPILLRLAIPSAWVFVVLTILSACGVFTSFFFDWPKPIDRYLPSKESGPPVKITESGTATLPSPTPVVPLKPSTSAPVRQEFSFKDIDKNCRANRAAQKEYCLGPAAQVEKWEISTSSANCGSRVENVRQTSSNCVTIDASIKGCGVGIIGDCKGRGWLEYRLAVSGKKGSS